ncbi:MAG: hypothetical protein ABIJ95_05325, partial [Pseudomonadota bacterium]
MIRKPFFAPAKTRLPYTLPGKTVRPVQPMALPEEATYMVDVPFGQGEASLAVGDQVLRGSLLAPLATSPARAVCAVAGEVKSIGPFKDHEGRSRTRITIRVSSEDRADDSLGTKPGMEKALKHLTGIAGNPDFTAFVRGGASVDAVVILGMDQDLGVTAVQQVMTDRAGDLAAGVAAIKKITGVSDVRLVVPPYLAGIADPGCPVEMADPAYPNFLPAMVMKRHLGRVLPAGQKPEHAGVVFLNAEAVANVGAAFASGTVAGEKVLTVVRKNGESVNVSARVGTPVGRILTAVHEEPAAGDRIVIGGPMRGHAVFSLDAPVEPDTDALMVQAAGTLPEILDQACVNCGECVRYCPARMPVN